RDNAKLVLELVEWVERERREPRDRRVEPAAGDHQQREARADLFVMDANLASFIERHGFLPFAINVGHPRERRSGETDCALPSAPLLRGRRLRETADYCAAARIGMCAFKKRRTRSIERCLSSSGSFHG